MQRFDAIARLADSEVVGDQWCPGWTERNEHPRVLDQLLLGQLSFRREMN